MMRARFLPGFSLLEMVLFLGIFAIVAGTLVAVFISTQDARIRQQGIAAVEQRGGQLLEILTRRIRRAEAIRSPVAGSTGSLLILQMAQNEEHPTIFSQSGGNLYVVEKTTIAPVLNDRLTLSGLQFRNIDGVSALLSFDLSIVLQLPKPITYHRHFETAVTLFPHDQTFEGDCNIDNPDSSTPVCPLPTCQNHVLQWYYCSASTCTLSPKTIRC